MGRSRRRRQYAGRPDDRQRRQLPRNQPLRPGDARRRGADRKHDARSWPGPARVPDGDLFSQRRHRRQLVAVGRRGRSIGVVCVPRPPARFCRSQHGQIANIGAYGNTAQASRSEPEYVHLVYPIGAEQLVPGRTYQIRWRTHTSTGRHRCDSADARWTRRRGANGHHAGSREYRIIHVGRARTWIVPPASDYTIVIARTSTLVPGTNVIGVSPFQFAIGPDTRRPYVFEHDALDRRAEPPDECQCFEHCHSVQRVCQQCRSRRQLPAHEHWNGTAGAVHGFGPRRARCRTAIRTR